MEVNYVPGMEIPQFSKDANKDAALNTENSLIKSTFEDIQFSLIGNITWISRTKEKEKRSKKIFPVT